MGGWNLFYGLLNFAILAAALYLVGRKLVAKMFAGRRDRIAGELDRSRRARENAEALYAEMAQFEAKADAECERIVTDAKRKAERQSRRAEAQERQSLAHIAEEAESEARQIRRTFRKALNRQAAAELTESAARMLAGEEYAAARHEVTVRFIAELSGRLSLTAADIGAFDEAGVLKARLASAEELPGELCSWLEEVLTDKLAQAGLHVEASHIHIHRELDEELIGGLCLYVGDTVYDGSIAGMLRRAARRIVNIENLDDELLELLESILRTADHGMEVYQTGRVVSLSDGICRVSGLSDAMSGELLEFSDELRGMVMDLEKDHVGVALLGNYEHVQEGDLVRRTGHIIEVPVGEELIGRVVDALGRPIDGEGEIHTREKRAVEGPAPGVIERSPVSVPMQTGIKAIDALVPIGRGQRELIIGDRQTGKTAIALDAIINQKGRDMICVYVAIGQKESTVASFVEKLREHGAMKYTIVVCAAAFESAPMLYIAPYSGTAIGEYFMHKGRDVLIVYDDLSKHAVAYREISLLLHRPPGREAYPGDVFYLHSRLLERAARLKEELGGGSMTALPIVETQAGDISAYIPTNVISITDGQVFLETDLFNAGTRPAVNVGLSVSRVGGSAQLGAMKQVAGRLRMDLAQYRELAAFSQFGSELGSATLAALRRGDRVTELLKQRQYEPMDAADQVVSLFAANEGYVDDVELKDVARFEKGLIAHVNMHYHELRGAIMSGSKLSQGELDRLRAEITEFKKHFK